MAIVVTMVMTMVKTKVVTMVMTMVMKIVVTMVMTMVTAMVITMVIAMVMTMTIVMVMVIAVVTAMRIVFNLHLASCGIAKCPSELYLATTSELTTTPRQRVHVNYHGGTGCTPPTVIYSCRGSTSVLSSSPRLLMVRRHYSNINILAVIMAVYCPL